MSVDFNNEEEVKEYMKNIGIEYRFGCYSEKNAQSCHLLGDYLESYLHEREKSANLYKQTCDLYNYGKSCDKYGALSFSGSGCPLDKRVAEEYFTRACRLDVKRGCYAGARLYLERVQNDSQLDALHAVELLERGCSLDSADCCFHLSGLHLTNSTGSQRRANLTDAFKYALRACELQNSVACANVSRMYQRGDGVKADAAKAQEYRDKYQQILKDARSSQVSFQQGLD